MWVGGELDRAKWYRHRFKEGHLVEAPVRDDAGKAQGFILLRVLNHESTASDGHLFAAEFLAASDSHYRWWMLEGEGKKMAKRGLYHSCEGNTADCGFTRGRHPLVHLEKFRIIGAREWSNKVPEWAFKGAARKDIEAFDLRMQSGKEKEEGEDAVPLPWAEAEEVQSAEEPSSDHPDSDDPGLGEKIQKMRDQLKKLELQQKKAKKAKAAQGAGKTTKDKRKDKAKVKDMEKQRAKSPSSEESKRRGRSRKPKRRRSKSKERDRKRRRRDATDVKKKKKKESSSDSGSQGPEVGLFEKGSHDDEVQDPIPRKGDRGPFGAGLPVAFDGEDTSDSDEGSVFQAAPPQPVKSGQQALITYSHRRPGRLAARLLIKMKNEVALGSGGASMSSVDKTPPIAVHYLLTLMMPQLGARMNLRTQRELRTIMVTLDLLAKKAPARAADILAQRVKALERATIEGHWMTAQYLELIPNEASSLLDRDEEVYLTKEYLQTMKVANYDRSKGGAGRGLRKGEKGKGKTGSAEAEGKGKTKKKGTDAT